MRKVVGWTLTICAVLVGLVGLIMALPSRAAWRVTEIVSNNEVHEARAAVILADNEVMRARLELTSRRMMRVGDQPLDTAEQENKLAEQQRNLARAQQRLEHAQASKSAGGWICIMIVVGAAIAVITFGGLGTFASRIKRYGARWRAPYADEVLERDDRAPMLYLRAFHDDESFQFGEAGSLEEFLGTCLNLFGPVVAIGRPGEWAPPLGAARIYVTDDKWKGKVLQLVRDCQVVLVTLAVTDGLMWELRQLFRSAVFAKLVVVFPPVPQAELERRWNVLVRIARTENIDLPPKISADAVFATFYATGDCRIHESRGVRRRRFFGLFGAIQSPHHYTKPLQAILRDRLGEPVQKSIYVTLVAIFSLLLGALALCGGFGRTLVLFTENPPSVDPALEKVSVVLTIVFGAFAVPGAIGVLKRRGWGREACLIAAGLSALAGLFISCLVCLLADGLVALIIAVLLASYAAWVAIVLTRRKSKREFS